jgi:hypothetical protein
MKKKQVELSLIVSIPEGMRMTELRRELRERINHIRGYSHHYGGRDVFDMKELKDSDIRVRALK